MPGEWQTAGRAGTRRSDSSASHAIDRLRGSDENRRFRSCGPGAAFAQTVQHHFVRLHLETRGSQSREILHAAVDLEDTVALATPEVVVMVEMGSFVARRLTGQLHRRQPTFGLQVANRAVYRCNAESRNLNLRHIQHFAGRKWAVGGLEGAADGVALAGLTLHIHRI